MAKTHAFYCRLNPGLGNPEHPRRELQVFDGSQVLVQAGRMGKEPDVSSDFDGVSDEMVTMDPTFTGRGSQSGGDHAQQGALSAAVMSNNPNNFTWLEVEGDSAKRPARSKSAGDALKLEGQTIGRANQGFGRSENECGGLLKRMSRFAEGDRHC